MSQSVNRVYLQIGITACAILFFELLLIRWISTEINIFAYLQNSILVVCFLGLGMGLLYPNADSRVTRFTVYSITALCLLLSVEESRSFANIAISGVLSMFHDFVTWYEFREEVTTSQFAGLFTLAGVLLLFYSTLVWGVMVPLGRRLGGLFEQAPSPIVAYSFDIGGSLIGTWLYSFLGYMAWPPTIWIVIGCVLLLPLTNRNLWPFLILCPLLTLLSYMGDSYSVKEAEVFWTPYQKIEISDARHRESSESEVDEFVVSTNNSGYQQIQNNSFERYEDRLDDLALCQYDIAASFHADPKSILIAGVGTGNDLAGAIRRAENATITGVEIDPVIARLGKKYHPEKPYQNERVKLVVEDARAAFHTLKEEKFDLVITGLLDAHTTPNLSNARLDNFVYTQESLNAAARLLTDDGVMVVSFDPQRVYIVERLRRTLDRVFGKETLVFKVPKSDLGWGGVLFVNGNQEMIQRVISENSKLASFIEKQSYAPDLSTDVKPTTDNWPYLYIEQPLIPSLFYVLGIVILVLWAFTSYLLSGKLVFPELYKVEPLHFFALGLGFIVIQVFIITKASLLFGSTWIVNAIVISGMMFTILIANYIVQRQIILSRIVVSLLLITLCVVLGMASFEPILSYDLTSRILIGMLLSGLPTILSGYLFGYAFQKAPNASFALGANLFGALVGAILQSAVFLFGISSLAYIGAMAYGLGLITISPRDAGRG